MRRIISSTLVLVLGAALIMGFELQVQAQSNESEQSPSLYERLGGLPAISVVVSDFLDAMVPDSMLNQNPAIAEARDRVPKAYLKYHVTAMVCQATGGPCEYHGRSMPESHAHLNISEAEWDRMLVILKKVFDKHNIPDKEEAELLAIVASTKDGIVSVD